MNTPTPITKSVASHTEAQALVAELQKLTPLQFESFRKQVSLLVRRQKTNATRRMQFFVTEDEFNAITAIAKREKIHASTLLRYYIRCLHPELGTLTARLRTLVINQQRLVCQIIQDERMDMAVLSKALADLEARTSELMRVVEERR
jgi:hypothetical protein